MAKAEEVVTLPDWLGMEMLVLSSNASNTIPSVMLSVYSNTLLLERQKVHKIATSPKIYVENHPLPYFVPQVVDTVQIFLPMFTGMGFMGIGLGGISLLKDRETRRRHLLRLRGLKPSTYVAGHLLFDLGVVGYPFMCLAVALIFVFDVPLKDANLVGWIVLATVSIFGTAIMGYVGNHVPHINNGRKNLARSSTSPDNHPFYCSVCIKQNSVDVTVN